MLKKLEGETLVKISFDTALLTLTDRLTSQLNPLAILADSIIERIAPKATAQAGCFFCLSHCTPANCAEPDKANYSEFYTTGFNCTGSACKTVQFGCQFC